MLLVKTYLGKSKIHGLGLFAGEFIPQGKLVWKFAPGFDFIIKDSDLKKFPKAAKDFVLHFGYYEKNKKRHVINPDDARFFNHSKNPNVVDINPTESIARRDIKKDEEITCNYFEFDDEADFKLSKK